jgi:hypothetical protein
MRAVHNARAGGAALAPAKRGAGSGIASLSAGSSEVARNQIWVRRGIVVSGLQQPALFALDYNCGPESTMIAAMIALRWCAGSKLRKEQRACGGFIFAAAANLLAWSPLKHRHFITRARELPFAGWLEHVDAALVPPTCIGRLLSPEETQNQPQPCGTS